jgi:hypothetical protein
VLQNPLSGVAVEFPSSGPLKFFLIVVNESLFELQADIGKVVNMPKTLII